METNTWNELFRDDFRRFLSLQTQHCSQLPGTQREFCYWLPLTLPFCTAQRHNFLCVVEPIEIFGWFLKQETGAEGQQCFWPMRRVVSQTGLCVLSSNPAGISDSNLHRVNTITTTPSVSQPHSAAVPLLHSRNLIYFPNFLLQPSNLLVRTPSPSF
jgi:hypothetical protein